MRIRLHLAAVTFAVIAMPVVTRAQSPLAEAFRENTASMGKKLMAAADLMPANKYTYKPTPAQMSFADIMVHLAQGNDFLCGAIGGVKAPTRTKVAATESKDALVARLRETFKFCDEAVAKLDDSKLSEQLSLFGSKMSRAAVELETTGDWSDHYSQMANYLRLNGVLPPGAKK